MFLVDGVDECEYTFIFNRFVTPELVYFIMDSAESRPIPISAYDLNDFYSACRLDNLVYCIGMEPEYREVIEEIIYQYSLNVIFTSKTNFSLVASYLASCLAEFYRRKAL